MTDTSYQLFLIVIGFVGTVAVWLYALKRRSPMGVRIDSIRVTLALLLYLLVDCVLTFVYTRGVLGMHVNIALPIWAHAIGVITYGVGAIVNVIFLVSWRLRVHSTKKLYALR